MNIYIDENIPYAKAFFSQLGNVHFFSGRSVDAKQLINADVLLVRSITKVNEQLLKLNNCLKFVGTATIGTDHIDQVYLQQRGITFTSAPGCNKISVAEYILSSLLVLAEQMQFQLVGKSVAIVGAGNTGSALFERLSALGVNCKLYDPPLQFSGDKRDFCSFSDVLEADIISLHVPKIASGQYPTVHMFDEKVLRQLSPSQILLNASRGDVIDNQALLKLAKDKLTPTLVLDVWENEPYIEKKLLPYITIATPHIAGYSLDGKARGTEILYNALCKFLSNQPKYTISDFLPCAAVNATTLSQPLNQSLIKSLVHLIFDVRRDDCLFRQMIDQVNGFDTMRKTYQERREFSTLTVLTNNNEAELLKALGFSAMPINNPKEYNEI